MVTYIQANGGAQGIGDSMGRFMDAGKGIAIAGALTQTVMTAPLAGMTPEQISDFSQASSLNPETSQALGETISTVNEAVQEASKGTQDAEDAQEAEPIDDLDYHEERETEQNNVLDTIEWDENEYTSVDTENFDDSEISDSSDFEDDQSFGDSEGGTL